MPLAITSTSNSSGRGSQRSICSMVNGPVRSYTTAAVIFIVVGDLFGGVSGLSHALDRFSEIFRRLRTGNCELAAKNKAGHPLDARFLCGKRLTFDFRNILVACQGLARSLSIETNISRGLRQ